MGFLARLVCGRIDDWLEERNWNKSDLNAGAPGNFSISRKESGLSRDSVVNISQLLTLDKSFLSEKKGKLSAKKRMILNEGLRLSLAL